MINLKIYVATHKEFEKDLPCYYQPILVGSYNKVLPNSNYIRDDINDNISKKNKNYCELTGLYWIWKNDLDSDIVGLCHYRRYFSGKENGCIDKKTIVDLLKSNDIIVPKAWYYLNNVYEDYCNHHYKRDIDNCGEIIKQFFPDYYNAYKNVMNRKYIYLYNMFICKKNLIDEYFEWMFAILEKMEDVSEISSYDDYQKRIYGFLSERLFNVWIEKEHLKVKEIKVCKIEDKKIARINSSVKNKIKKMYVKCIENKKFKL